MQDQQQQESKSKKRIESHSLQVFNGFKLNFRNVIILLWHLHSSNNPPIHSSRYNLFIIYTMESFFSLVCSSIYIASVLLILPFPVMFQLHFHVFDFDCFVRCIRNLYLFSVEYGAPQKDIAAKPMHTGLQFENDNLKVIIYAKLKASFGRFLLPFFPFYTLFILL